MSDAYNVAKERLATGQLAWDDSGKDFTVVALADTYTFDPDHDDLADVNTHELTGTGTRAPVENRTVAKNLTDDRAELDADDSTLPEIDTSEDIAFLVVAEDGVDDASSPLVAFLSAVEGDNEASFDLATNGADVLVAFPSGRVARIE